MSETNAAASDVPLAAFVQKPARPYPGLRPFRADEWSIFCGRETETREVLYKLGEHNLVLVHGGSGCGKSSLIAAGVLPSLERDMELAGSILAHAVIRPSQGPLGALADALAATLRDARRPSRFGATADWTTALTLADDVVEQIEEAIAVRGIDLFCLVIDQFEEIFAWLRQHSGSDVETMTRLLAALATPGRGKRLVIILTMRSDFLGQCALFPNLGAVINRCQYYIPNLDQHALERAIREPAAMYGGTIDDALVTRLMTEAMGNVDALPVLQHALMRMSEPAIGERMAAWRLTLADHRRVTTHRSGDTPPESVGNALSVHAEEIRNELIVGQPPERAQAVEAVFRALTETDAAGRIIRHPTEMPILEAMAGRSKAHIPAVVAAFEAEGANLLHCSEDPARKVKIVDISHEALLRNWWRMSSGPKGIGPGWIQAEADDALTWQTLARIATTGEELDRRLLHPLKAPYVAFAAAPERVRRYLVRDEKKPRVVDEPEWNDVESLMQRSLARERRRRLMVRGAYAVLLATLTGALVLYLWLSRESVTRIADVRDSSQARNARLVATAKEVLKERETSGEPITADEAALIRLVEPDPDTGSDAGRSGYIWIGDGGTTNLRPRGNGRLLASADAVRRDQTYTLSANVALRASLPDRNNRSQRISALKLGTKVVALGEPARAANGQYWLRVRPIQQTTVYVQYASGDPTQLQRQLVAAGFQVPPAERLATAANMNEVRYCRLTDRPAAERAATALAVRLGAELDTRFIGKDGACARVAPPGTIEAWIGDASRAAVG